MDTLRSQMGLFSIIEMHGWAKRHTLHRDFVSNDYLFKESSLLNKLFYQPVNGGATKGAWPINTCRIVAQFSAADCSRNVFVGKFSHVDTFVVIRKVTFQPFGAIPRRCDIVAILKV